MLGVDHLSFNYVTGPILRDINFQISPGRVWGLLGPNASGKTTLFKCINAVLQPCSGQVTAFGHCLARLPRRKIAGLMAVVPQQTDPAFSYTAFQMVLMGKAHKLGVWQRPSARDRRNAALALEELGAADLGHRLFNTLSGGEKQVVLLARALFQAAPILLLDEPTAHLDFKNQHLILDLIAALAQRRKLMVLVSLHDPNLAARYCDGVVVLKEGQVLQKGPAREVMNQPVLEAVYGMKLRVNDPGSGGLWVTPRINDARPV